MHLRIHRSPVVLLASVLAVATMAAEEPVDRATIAKIRDEGLNRSQASQIFAHLTTHIGPRLTASPAFKAAVDWTRSTLEKWQLARVAVEPFEFGRGWSMERVSVELVEPRYFPLIGYPSGWSPPTAGRLVATPVWLGETKPDELGTFSGRLKGAIVMRRPIQTIFERADRPTPVSEAPETPPPPMSAPPAPSRAPQSDRAQAQAMQEFFEREQVGAILDPNRGEHGTVFVTGRDGGANAIPTIVLAAEHYNMIARMLQQGVPVRVAVDLQTRFYEQDRNAYNVIAELPGTGDEVVMAGAHLDSWHTGTGATDNADGVTIAMEALRILKTIGVKPRRTIRIALWGGEEQGLLGSRAWVQKHLAGDANRAARERFSVYFNLDNGIAPLYGFFLEGNEAMRPIMQAWLDPFRDLVTPVITLQSIGATDHFSFINVGLPGFQAVQNFTQYDVRTHHTNMDTVERLDESALKRSAVIMASVLYHAATRDQPIPRKPGS